MVREILLQLSWCLIEHSYRFSEHSGRRERSKTNPMKNLCIISFDLIRQGDPSGSLAIASLLAYLKQDERYGHAFHCTHTSFNLLENPCVSPLQVIQTLLEREDLSTLDYIALSCYVWSEFLINPVIQLLRSHGFSGAIILGGYQISYANNQLLQKDYPDCQIFVKGYAEESLLQALFSEPKDWPLVLNEEPDFSSIPSAYLSGEIVIAERQARVRFETKRGCPYRCSFCAHRDLQRNRVYRHEGEKILQELRLFQEKHVQKINVLDPVFNLGQEYLPILEYMNELRLKAQVALQTRFENIQGSQGERFLDLCTDLNVLLEFGLQSIQEAELEVIHRKNKKGHIETLFKRLHALNIPYEISLIYGLPNQTFSSFKGSVDFLKAQDCQNIKAYPLMLLKGTELYEQREKWNCQEKVIGDFHIPVVVSANSFDEQEWFRMKALAESLDVCERY